MRQEINVAELFHKTAVLVNQTAHRIEVRLEPVFDALAKAHPRVRRSLKKASENRGLESTD